MNMLKEKLFNTRGQRRSTLLLAELQTHLSKGAFLMLQPFNNYFIATLLTNFAVINV